MMGQAVLTKIAEEEPPHDAGRDKQLCAQASLEAKIVNNRREIGGVLRESKTDARPPYAWD